MILGKILFRQIGEEICLVKNGDYNNNFRATMLNIVNGQFKTSIISIMASRISPPQISRI